MPLSFTFTGFDQDAGCEIVGSNTPFVMKLCSVTNEPALLLFGTDTYDEIYGSSNHGYWMGAAGASATTQPLLVFGSNAEQMITLNQDGNLGIGTTIPSYKLHCSGDVFAQGDIKLFQMSDRRAKTDVHPVDLDECLRAIQKIPMNTWTWAHNQKEDRGWIAQDVEPILPFAVHTSEALGISDFKMVNHDDILKCLYGAVQRLVQKVEDLDQDIMRISRHFPNLRR